MSYFSAVIQGGDLTTALRDRLAQILDLETTETSAIPLGLCFRCRGLGFRSAIALKYAARTGQDPHSVAQGYLERLIEVSRQQLLPNPNNGLSLTWKAIATERGWLEFWLIPSDIGRWLDQLLIVESPTIPSLDTNLLFACHYLQARCQDLSTLARDYADCSPQWHFDRTPFSVWEQALLEAIAHCALASLNDHPQPHLIIALEKSLGEFLRHCTLFYFLRSEPERGAHYWQWLTYLRQFLQQYLPASQDFFIIPNL
ncbi:MAG: hypothetical protein VKJ86_07570 [Synechococcus sp.]|nr:hypothetical protein [Synechococcus sp.]